MVDIISTSIFGIIGLSNGLVHDGTKLSPEPMRDEIFDKENHSYAYHYSNVMQLIITDFHSATLMSWQGLDSIRMIFLFKARQKRIKLVKI